tara:strand:+ start:4711 stop:5445 length:735 start_codon:yes stop_codon:yes gene_type:complete
MLLILSIIIVFSSSAYLYKNVKKQHSVDWGCKFLNRAYQFNQLICRKYHRLGDNFWLNLPEKGGALIVANHQSGLDILLLVAASKRKIRFIAAKEYCDMRFLGKVFRNAGCIPVDRKKKSTFTLQEALKVVEQGEIVALFPFGGFHLPKDDEPKIKSGAAIIAKNTKAPIYSVYISGLRSLGSVFFSLVLPRSKACLELKSIKTCNDENMDTVLQELSNELSNKMNYPGIKKTIPLDKIEKEAK